MNKMLLLMSDTSTMFKQLKINAINKIEIIALRELKPISKNL